MNSDEKNEKNQAAYRRLRETINATYPEGRFVAIADGKIVADAATLEEIEQLLQGLGIESRNSLVAQAGTPDMDNWVIFPVDYTA